MWNDFLFNGYITIFMNGYVTIFMNGYVTIFMNGYVTIFTHCHVRKRSSCLIFKECFLSIVISVCLIRVLWPAFVQCVGGGV